MKSTTLYKALLLSFLITGFAGIVKSQTCGNYYPLTTGSGWEMTNYNDKGKVEGKTVSLVTQSVTTATGGTIATVQTISKDKKDTVTGKSSISIKCEAGKVYVDMKNFAPAKSSGQGKDMEVKTDGSFLEIPQTLSVGLALPDANGTITISNASTVVSTMKISITNRKVASQGTITIGNDIYDCYEITQDVKVEMIVMGITVPTNTKSSEYYAPNTGLVKSETFDKNNKLMGYSELTKITKK